MRRPTLRVGRRDGAGNPVCPGPFGHQNGSLDSKNPDIHCEAVLAAGNWEVDAAWPHVVALVTSEETDKALLLAAIEAVASIRPHEAAEILDDLADSDDEDIVAAVHEAMAMTEGPAGEDDDSNDDDDSLH